MVETYHALGIAEGLEEMEEAIWSGEGSDYGAFTPFVAAVIDGGWDIGPDGIADGEIGNMTGADPGGHEQTKDYITNRGVAEVLETFCQLNYM